MSARRIGSLFSGIEGIGRGLTMAQPEWSVAWCCEVEPHCREVLAARHPDVPVYGDVAELSGGEVEPVGVLAFGFPCQDLSPAGKGAGMTGARSGLWAHGARLVGELRPDYVVVENVPALLVRGASTGYGGGMERVLTDLREAGMDAEWDCIPAAAIGAPHLRDRVWILAYPREAAMPYALGGTVLGRWAHFDAADGEWHDPQATLFGGERVVRWPRAGRLVGDEVFAATPVAPMSLFRSTTPYPTPREAADRASRASVTRDGHWSAVSLGQAAELANGELPREFESVDELTPQARALFDAGRAQRFPTPTSIDGTMKAVGRPDSYGRHAVQLSHLANSGALAEEGEEAMWDAHQAALAEHFEGRAIDYGPDGEKRAADRFPTPQASDHKGADLAREENRSGRRHSGDDLPTHAARFPTPTVQDAANNGSPSQFERNSLPLNAEVHAREGYWPTPEASDGSGGRNGSGALDRAEAEGQQSFRTLHRPSGAKAEFTLRTAVEAAERGLWQTPTAAPWDEGGGGGELQAQVNAAEGGEPEPGKARVYPTPTAADGERTSEQGPRHYVEGGDNPTLLGAARRAEDEEDAPACGCPWDYVDADGFCACCQAHLDDPAGLYALQGDGSHAYERCPRFGQRLWPTPKASPSGPDYARAGREDSGGDDLATAVARTERLPTPRASDGDPRNRGDLIAHAKERPNAHHPGERAEGREEERRVGALNPAWVELLMGYPLGWTDPAEIRPADELEVAYAATRYLAAIEAVQGVRRDDGAQALQRAARGRGRVPETGALLAVVREYTARADEGRVLLPITEAAGSDVRGVRDDEAPSRAPRGPGLHEQHTGERADAVQELSRLLARHAEAHGLGGRWQDAVPAQWTGGWEDDIARVCPNVDGRAKRLSALGNSVVPQVIAAWAGRLS